MKIYLSLVVLIITMISTVACSAQAQESQAGSEVDIASIGDAANGEKLFNQFTIGANAPGCVTCHAIEPGVTLVGPSQHGLAARSLERINNSNYTGKAQTAADYIRESIVTPNAYIADGFSAGLMYQKYGEALTEKEINDLVAYSLTLK